MRPQRIHLLVEGQTEETITRDVFSPFLEENGWLVSWSIVLTKRPAAAPAHHGGLSRWSKLDKDIKRLLHDSSLDVLTTVLDYYRFPADAPGMANRPASDAFSRVMHVEQALAATIGDRRFVPHLTLHETEAWVYAAADRLGQWLDAPGLATTLQAEAAAAGGPELVNDGPATAPSRRLARHCPGYDKVLDGPLAVVDLGLAELRRSCPHLDRWFERLAAVHGRGG